MAAVAAGHRPAEPAQVTVTPRPPRLAGPAAPLGADNAAVDRMVGEKLGTPC